MSIQSIPMLAAAERTSTSLRFVGDWPWWAGLGAGLVLAAIAFLLYRRDVASVPMWVRGTLPCLRALSVFMIVAMLSGPVLHHRTVIGELSRLLLFVDSSRSMELADPSMDLGRKLRVLQRLGYLREEAVKMELPKASEALGEARALALSAKTAQGAETSEWNRILTDFSAQANEARDLIAASGVAPGKVEMFNKDLSEPARELASREMRQTDDRKRAAQDIGRLGEIATRWQGEVRELFEKSVQESAAGGQPELMAALQKFDNLPRWQRLQALLTESTGEQSLIMSLAAKHDVQLFTLDGAEARKVWQPSVRDSSPPAGLPKPAADFTNLTTGIRNILAGGQQKDQKGAVVIFSDGQHNEGASPIEAAKVLAAQQMPVFTVGLGSTTHPRDLAILRVNGPESVFSEDRMRGQIVLKEELPAGVPYTLSIQDGEKVVWEQRLASEARPARIVAYDFPVNELVKERLGKQREGVQVSGLPLEMKVLISKVEGDREASNNQASLRVRAVTQRRKILLVDGRARWEARYLRNMFERDEQWEMNALFAGGVRGESGFVRGDKPGQFPSDPMLLSTYDLIIFGEVPRTLFKPDELVWMREFVEKRGGAIAFVDGPRGLLKEYVETPLGSLLPVEWKSPAVRDGISRYLLSERAQSLSTFALLPDRGENVELWRTLQPAHWVSGATPLPGAEVLLELETPSAPGGRLPAVVFRPFGAGRAIYHAFEDSWRWRYEVADRHHVRYWNQLANWIAELPFAVRDKFISLDAGAITYRPGDSAEVRVRLRDGQGRPVDNAVVDAILYRNGQRAATIRVTPDDNAGGLFRGRTAALEPGEYEVAVESPAIPSRDTLARTSFKVEPRETGELSQLSLNEELLQQVAAQGGGQYLREEQIGRLLELLAPMSEGKVIERDTPLWQSWWWFLPIVALLTVEWLLRKRSGLL